MICRSSATFFRARFDVLLRKKGSSVRACVHVAQCQVASFVHVLASPVRGCHCGSNAEMAQHGLRTAECLRCFSEPSLMWLVTLSQAQPDSEHAIKWSLQFRSRLRGIRFAQEMASLFCRYCCTSWCISVYRVGPYEWPADWTQPLCAWLCR